MARCKEGSHLFGQQSSTASRDSCTSPGAMSLKQLSSGLLIVWCAAQYFLAFSFSSPVQRPCMIFADDSISSVDRPTESPGQDRCASPTQNDRTCVICDPEQPECRSQILCQIVKTVKTLSGFSY